MRVALVTTPPSVRSGIGDYTRHLLPYLREHCQVDVFVRPEAAAAIAAGEEEWPGEEPGSILELDPNAYDQVMFQLGNELNHAFMPRMVRHMGGTVMQHDWVLFDLALAAYPGLVRGGWKGHALALREGGLEQAKRYMKVWLDRRRERNQPADLPDCHGELGQLLTGWHATEPGGRWIADRAFFRIPALGVTRVEVGLGGEPGRRLALSVEGGPRADFPCTKQASGTLLAVDLEGTDEPYCRLDVSGIVVTPEQRSHGDCRRLGAFVETVAWHDAEGRHELDLSLPPKFPIRPVDLSRDRFEMPLNRSIVDHADAFIVHSNYVGDLIKQRRGQDVPMGLLPHGSEKRWPPHEDRGDRRELRTKLGLPAAWEDGFLVVSFGGVQPHKRIDRLLAGLVEARKTRDDVYMVLAGGWHPDNIDPVGIARMLGVDDAVHFTGYVPEDEAWDWIHAGDISVNLRGPTSGGTSGGIYQSLSLGRAVVATGEAEQAELPADCIPKVPLGEGEVEAIGELLVELAGDPERCAALEAAARRYVEEDCFWGIVGKRYHDHLASFPRPQVSAAKLESMRAELRAFCTGEPPADPELTPARPSVPVHHNRLDRPMSPDVIESAACLAASPTEHPLYAALDGPDALRRFQASHVFAVWDFQSLLKALQRHLTCVDSPWLPTEDPVSRRLINEIVLEEESDVHPIRGHASHFELYLDAMAATGADTAPIERLLASVRAGRDPREVLAEGDWPPGAARFVTWTFDLIERDRLHELAAAFTHGREEVIPDMFRQVVARLADAEPERWELFRHYLERHIELDGEEHGPAALEMVSRACGADPLRVAEARETASRALEERSSLWDAVLESL